MPICSCLLATHQFQHFLQKLNYSLVNKNYHVNQFLTIMGKKTTPSVASLASKVMNSSSSSSTAKSLAASTLAQTNTGKQTGAAMEDLASRVLDSSKYSAETKTLAGSVLSQSVKER